jgi:hypothetical protein
VVHKANEVRLEDYDEEEWDVYAEAFRIVGEYQDTLSGISYQAMGYHLGDGITLPARKLDEHRAVHRLYGYAQEDANSGRNIPA